MHNFFKRHKKFIMFVLTIIIVSLIIGFAYYYFLDKDTILDIKTTLEQTSPYLYNFIFKDLIVMSIILVMSFFVIGIPLSFFYIFYEFFTIGFIINVFFSIFGFKGLIYVLLYFLINKSITLILKVIFVRKVVNIGRFIIGSLIYKKDDYIKNKLFINFRNSLYIVVFTVIINTILYFVSPLIFKKILFLLK